MDTEIQAKPKTTGKKGNDQVAVAVDPNKVIVFRAFRKTQLPAKISPLANMSGKHYTGQGVTGYYEDLSEDVKKSMAYVITPSTVIVLREGMSLFVGQSQIDAANWKWMQKHPYIALKKEDGQHNRDAVYYVYDQVTEAETSLTRTEKLDEAAWMLRSASHEKCVKLAQAFGFGDAESASLTVIKHWLREKLNEPERAVSHAIKMIAILGGDEASLVLQDAMALFNQLLHYSIVQKYRGGVYRWAGENGIILGSTEEACIKYLSHPDNVENVEHLKVELAEKKTTQ